MKKRIIVTAILGFWAGIICAQGCSDAGFCTVHGIKNNTITNTNAGKNELAAGFVFGKGERSISYYTWELEYTRNFTERTSATAKLGYSFIDGELAKTNGLTDLFLSVNHRFDNNSKWKKSFLIGVKYPFDKSNISKNGIQLPMPYQTSLGTTDLVAGITVARNAFGATLAVQQPLKPINGNRFLPTDYPVNSLANSYLPSNEFARKGDVLLRLSYDFALTKRFSLRPSLLGIYHEVNDTYVDANKLRREIGGSSGLTANANLFANYRLNKTSAIELSLGTPFIVRTSRPDGLTRYLVAAFNYRYSF